MAKNQFVFESKKWLAFLWRSPKAIINPTLKRFIPLTMVKNTVLFTLFTLLFSCSEDRNLPMEKEETEEVTKEEEDPAYPVCGFELDEEGDPLPLIGDWEFVGFELLETGDFHPYTCTARLAHLSYYQGGYDDRLEAYDFPLYLKLTGQKWTEEDPSCEGRLKLETRTHLGVLYSCFSYDEEGAIEFEVGLPYWDFPENGTIIFPEESHHIAYTEALENAVSFKIEANRLYVYYDSEDYRMVFLELVENQ